MSFYQLRIVLLVTLALVLAGPSPASARRLVDPSSTNITGVEAIDIGVGCGKTTYPADEITDGGALIGPTFTYVISNPLAAFLSVRFTQLNLPANDFVIVRPTHSGPSEARSFTYRSGDKPVPFLSDELITKSITIELYSVSGGRNVVNASQCTGFTIDSYRYLAVAANAIGSEQEDVCGVDESREAACFKMFPEVFNRSSPVMRLLIHKSNGSFFCTGWLFGCEGHVLTNRHCIETPDHAANTKFEFHALGPSCDTDCEEPLGCRGDVRASSAQLVAANENLDYALVKLDENLSNDYGYLSMRESGAVAGERVYLPQHPAGWGKRIAMKADQDWGKIESLTQGGCLANQLSYSLDTQGGSSGSPLLAYPDNVVVGLHHCGGCPNTAINARDIVADLKSKGVLPNCAVA